MRQSWLGAACVVGLVYLSPIGSDCGAATRAEPLPVVAATSIVEAEDAAVAQPSDVLAAGMPAIPINAILLSLAAVGLMVMARRGPRGA